MTYPLFDVLGRQRIQFRCRSCGRGTKLRLNCSNFLVLSAMEAFSQRHEACKGKRRRA